MHLTKDGHLLVSHDADFKRLCGLDKKVCDTNLKDVPKRFSNDVPNFFGCDYYTLKPGDKCEFTSLEQVFKALPKEQMICVDIKDANKKQSCYAM